MSDRPLIQDIAAAIERYAPRDTAEEWDNVGLMLGDAKRECTGVVTALDCTLAVARQAKEEGCNLIVTHHPFIFRPLDRLTADTAKGRTVEFLFANGISVYSAHTNLDKAERGLNSVLAAKFGARGEVVHRGCGCFAEVAGQSAKELARRVADVLGDPTVKVCAPDARVGKIYVVSGAGGGSEELAEAMLDADALVTGEVRHHVYLDASESGFPVVEFSHYYSEKICCDVLKGMINSAFGGLKVVSARSECPYKTLEEL